MQVTFDTSANQLDTQFLESIKTLFQNKQIKITVQDTEISHQTPIFGCMKGSVTIYGDITEPTGEIWDAENAQ